MLSRRSIMTVLSFLLLSIILGLRCLLEFMQLHVCACGVNLQVANPLSEHGDHSS